jgi:uncharacterized protein (DUF2141 family)
VAVLAILGAASPDVPFAQAAAPAPASLEVTVSGGDNDKGTMRFAVCPVGSGFPDCGAKAVRTATVAVRNGQARAQFVGLAPGSYAVSAFHDANNNGRLDTFLGIPREGFGFSRNPKLRMRAPTFGEAQLLLSGESVTTISLRYIL